MKKLMIGTSLVLATLAATPSFAQSRLPAQQPYAGNAGYDAYAAADSSLTTSGPAIYANGVYAGWDPDPTIRLQLMRDPGLQTN